MPRTCSHFYSPATSTQFRILLYFPHLLNNTQISTLISQRSLHSFCKSSANQLPRGRSHEIGALLALVPCLKPVFRIHAHFNNPLPVKHGIITNHPFISLQYCITLYLLGNCVMYVSSSKKKIIPHLNPPASFSN